jgi:hypothetical protein
MSLLSEADFNKPTHLKKQQEENAFVFSRVLSEVLGSLGGAKCPLVCLDRNQRQT